MTCRVLRMCSRSLGTTNGSISSQRAEQHTEEECLLNHLVKVKGALWRMDGVEVRELAKRDLSRQVKHDSHASGSLVCWAEPDSSNQRRPWCEHSSQLLTDNHCANPGGPLGYSLHAQRWRGSYSLQNHSQQPLSEHRQPYCYCRLMCRDNFSTVPYTLWKIESIMNFLNIHSFHKLSCARWNFISACAPGGQSLHRQQLSLNSKEKKKWQHLCTSQNRIQLRLRSIMTGENL